MTIRISKKWQAERTNNPLGTRIHIYRYGSHVGYIYRAWGMDHWATDRMKWDADQGFCDWVGAQTK